MVPPPVVRFRFSFGVWGVWLMVYDLWLMVYDLLFMVYGFWFTVMIKHLGHRGLGVQVWVFIGVPRRAPICGA